MNRSNRALGLVTAIAVVTLFTLASCATEAKEDPTLTLPSASELTASGATVPVSAAGARDIYIGAMDAIYDETYVPSTHASPSARAAQTSTETYNETIQAGDGTINLKGKFTGTYDYGGVEQDPDWFMVDADIDTTATFNNATVAYYATEYLINGVQKTKGSFYFRGYDMKSAPKLNAKINLLYGTALSIKNNAGAGGKFILSLYWNLTANDLNASSGETPLGSLNGSLSVYNDSNILVHTVSLDYTDLEGIIPFFGL